MAGEAVPAGAPAVIQPATDHLQAIEQGIMSQIPPEAAEALEKVVLSGRQILYDPSTHSSIMENFRDIQDDSDPRKVALGVSALLTMVNREAESIPVELMIPAGALLCVEVEKFLEESGMLETDPSFTGNMIEEYLAIAMQKTGMPKPGVPKPPVQGEIPGGVSPSTRQAPPGIIEGAVQ